MSPVNLAGLSAALALAAAAPPSAGAEAAPLVIHIDNFAFGPSGAAIPTGTTVTWVNDDDAPHTVVAVDGKSFRSRALDSGERFSFTFTSPGTWSYFCSVHPQMTGKVVVKAS